MKLNASHRSSTQAMAKRSRKLPQVFAISCDSVFLEKGVTKDLSRQICASRSKIYTYNIHSYTCGFFVSQIRYAFVMYEESSYLI